MTTYKVGDRVRYDDTARVYNIGTDIWEGFVVGVESYADATMLLIKLDVFIQNGSNFFFSFSNTTRLHPASNFLSLVEPVPAPQKELFNRKAHDDFMRGL